MTTPISYLATPALLALLLSGLPLVGHTAPAVRAGAIDCVIDAAGAGYRDRQEHHWEVAGSTALAANAIQILAGTWTVRGDGELSRTQGTQTLTAHWTTSGTAAAPMSVFLRAADGMIILKGWHAQLRIRNGIQGEQQLFVGGQPQRPVALGLEAFEWAAPIIQGAANAAALAGAITVDAPGPTGPLQPGNVRGKVACRWNFALGN